MINGLWGVVVLLYKCLATPWHDYSLSKGNKYRANIESLFCWASVAFGQRSSIDCQRSAGVGAKRVEQRSITSVAVNQNSTPSNSSQTLKHKYPSINLHPKQLPLQWEVWHVHCTSSSRASRWRKFQKKQELYSKEAFAYRMCARWPTIAMSKFFLGLNEAFAVAGLWCHALCGDVFVIWLAFKWCG